MSSRTEILVADSRPTVRSMTLMVHKMVIIGFIVFLENFQYKEIALLKLSL